MSLIEHSEHKWGQQGRCVYCVDCGVRLYQGKLPAPGKQKEEAEGVDKALDAMRAKIIAKVEKEWDERTPEQHKAWEEGKTSYVDGESIMDRMGRGNPYKGSPLAAWFNRGWQNAENAFYERETQNG